MIRAGAVLALGLAVACRGPEVAPPPEPTEKALADELLAMAVADQDARSALLVVPRDARREYGAEGKDVVALIHRLDRRHADRLEQIVDRYGWPGRSLVGDGASHAAWLLVQHADHRPDLQERCLGLMREAVESGEAERSDLAYLEDRVRAAQGRLQLYGTQLEPDGAGGWRPLPLEDPEHVDRRRAAVGLPPLADYLEMVRQLQPK